VIRQLELRLRILAAVLGSARAEGSEPPASVKQLLDAYARGNITAEQLRTAIFEYLNTAERVA
jgi:predicted NBD/HSP70 family sugar kinase